MIVWRAFGAAPRINPSRNLDFFPFQFGFEYRPSHSLKFPSSNPPLSQYVCPRRPPLSSWCGHRA
eukprot:856725-Rhodomonas_salina.1